jgi:superfamily II DNA or RNA helicase
LAGSCYRAPPLPTFGQSSSSIDLALARHAGELAAWLDTFAGTQRQRGKTYQREGRVRSLRIIGTRASAKVQGTELYSVRFDHDPAHGWASLCTCPFEIHCKHAYAAGLALLDRLREAPAEEVPDFPAPAASDRLAEHVATRLGRALKRTEQTWLRRLAEAHALLLQGGQLDPHAISWLLPPSHRHLAYGYNERPWCDGWWERDQPPATPLELWSILAVALQRRQLPLPEFLLPLTDLPAAQARIAAREEALALRSWTRHFEQLQAALPAVSASDTLLRPTRHELRLRLIDRAWRWETRLAANATWEELHPETLRQWLSDSRSLTLLFDEPALRLALAFRDAVFLHGSAQPSPKVPEFRTALHAALTDPLARSCLVGPAREPLTLAPAPLVWTLRTRPGDAGLLEAVLTRADGSPAPNHLVLLEGTPTPLYLDGATIHRGPLPLAETKSPAAPGDAVNPATPVPLPRSLLTLPAAMSFFQRSGVRLPADLQRPVREEFLRPHLRLTLEFLPGAVGQYDEAESQELLCVEFTTLAADGSHRERYTPLGWRELAFTPPPEPAAGTLVLYDRAPAQAAVTPFLRFGLRWAATHAPQPCWQRAVTADFADELADWIATLPADTVIEATDELAGLVRPPDLASFALEVEPDSHARDWFDVRLVARAEDTTFTKEEIALLLAARGGFVRLRGKGWRRLTLGTNEAQQARLIALGLTESPVVGEHHRFHALQLASDESLREVFAARAWEQLRLRAIELRAEPPPAVPATVTAELRPYQREGFEFLAWLAHHGLGGVLADDMGLGKTVQALVWLVWLAARDPAKPFRALVICPKSVTTNWPLEAARFTPTLGTTVFDPAAPRAGPAAAAHLVIANYAQLRLNPETFATSHWDAVILDEGQNIKNPGSATAQSARALRATHRLVLTGTPVENRLLDLWSLYAFAMPGLLGSQRAFKSLYDDKADSAGARTRLAARVRHFLLRRTKNQVARDLPPRIEEEIVCELEGAQRTLYDAELKRARQILLGVHGAREFDSQRFNILQSLLRLRQICCDPRLIGGGQHGSHKPSSAKLDALLETLEPLFAEGHKVLVFSQFVTMLELIRDELVQREIPHLMLTGQTENRQALVDRFQSDPAIPVFLLSLKAAGSGLNLTAASYVVLYDPWWNPAVEAQAIDRTHRIGQRNQVIAYRLLARGTVEEKIRALQREKAALAAAVVQEESLASVLDLESLRHILS